MKFVPLILVVALAAACASPRPSQQATGRAQVAEVRQATEMIGPDWPALPATIATTSGEIYLGNLDSQIEVLSRQPQRQGSIRLQLTLAGLLYQRFQIEGRLRDAERARDMLTDIEAMPRFRADDRLLFAQVLLGFHDFEAAGQQIAAAESAGATPRAVAAARAAILQARSLPGGNFPHAPDAATDYVSAVRRSAELLDRGQLAEASGLLRRAQVLYRDVNPLPLAWIHLQQGIAYLRHGEYRQAQVFFAAAHERFPQYFLAAEHLAETEALLGNHERAAELYRQVTAQNDQPGFWHGLAQAEAALGNDTAARHAARKAREGYARLLVQYPLMYADHAVGYYLDIGDSATAMRLARLNFDHRQDLSAHLALAEALLGEGQGDAACRQVRAVREAGLAPPELSQTGEPLGACFQAP